MAHWDTDPVNSEEPGFDDDFTGEGNIWMRGLWMLVFAFLVELAKTILAVVALIQFLWMLFTKEKNELLVDFGRDLGTWLQDVARFQTGSTEQKPFPWAKWG